MRYQSLQQWLQWQETLHPAEIELGLERVSCVFKNIHPEAAPFVVITIAGTNGKGSTVALLEAMLLAAGYKVGCYTSPHILKYNERVRVNGEMASDAALCNAFERVDRARDETSLTYFEFGTLAALDIFYDAGLDVVVLEVGMGGRLDAVNILDPDVALITSVDIDHRQWLGDDREAIGGEKAGIFRSGRWAICNDPQPPKSVLNTAERVGARLLCLDRDYGYEAGEGGWSWHYGAERRSGLPLPNLRGDIQLRNACGVILALYLLQQRLPLSLNHIRAGLLAAQLPGRFQVIPGTVPTILDVAHNAEAIGVLASNLQQQGCQGRTIAVFGAMKDKELGDMLIPLCGMVDSWHVATLPTPRAASAELLQSVVETACTGKPVCAHGDMRAALAAAETEARDGDRIVGFGSFFTVAELLPFTV